MKRSRLCLMLAVGLGICLSIVKLVLTRARAIVAAQSSASQSFNTDCQLPFEAIKQQHPIDGQCPAGGYSALHGGEQMHILQNLAKNNFCITGAPVAISYNDFVNLQTAVNQMKDLAWGSGSRMPTDRTPLQNLKLKSAGGTATLGEGTKVMYAAFVMDAIHDDTSKGEDVNCKLGSASSPQCGDKSGRECNDIHIALRTQPGSLKPAAKGQPDPRCSSTTAEISPHYRPAVWDKFDSAQYRKVFAKYPVRITGTLMFDAEHRPCTNNIPATGSPVRISVWEIHPVYAIDVCKYTTLARCQTTDASAWTPLDQYQLGGGSSARR